MVSKITVTALVLIVAVPILLGYGMAFHEETITGYESSNSTNVTDLVNNVSIPIYNRYTGTSNNQVLYMDVYWTGVGWEKVLRSPGYAAISTNPSSWPILTSQIKTYTDIISTDYTEISEKDFIYTSDGKLTFRVTKDDGTEQFITPASGKTVMRCGSIIIYDDNTYSNVYKLEASALLGVPVTMSIYELVDGSDYGDPAYGWNPVPAGTGYSSVQDVYWMNGYNNSSVRMCVQLANGEGTTITPISSSGTSQTPDIYLDYSYVGGLVIDVGGEEHALGDYTKIYLEITPYSMKISGLSNWPTIGVTPTTYNTITIPYTDIGDIAQIYIDGNSNIEYRVDSAEVLTGYYPAVKDGNFSVGGYYPERTVLLSFSSIAVYGDEFGWGGQVWNVVDGKLQSANAQINGLRVKDLVLMQEYVENDGNPYYNFYVNNILISNFNQGGLLWLGGDWSLIVKASTMESTESTQLVWQPGEFAWNGVDSNFALIGLITTAGVFVGLGMYGARSGAKVGKLMIVCGCAAFIFLALM